MKEIDKLKGTIQAIRSEAFAATNPANWQAGDTSDQAKLKFYEETLNRIADDNHEIDVLEKQFRHYFSIIQEKEREIENLKAQLEGGKE